MTRERSRSAILCGLAILSCGFAGSTQARAANDCAALQQFEISSAVIGLPSKGAHIDEAQVVDAAGDLPAMCRVRGHIRSSDLAAPSIRFQINLPLRWNGKALQLGGGGFNGTLVDGLRNMPGNPAVPGGPANPLARGYATFGSDGGHQAVNPFDASFGRNGEARRNYMGEAVKRLHDAAVTVIVHYYGSLPKRVYYAGGSKGGHEALVAAQRYGGDFDGIIAFYPAKDSVGLIFGWGALTQAAYGPGGTPLTPAKQDFIRRKTLEACDALDGIVDGIVANTDACSASISPISLACKDDAKPETCLTRGEVATLDAGLRRIAYPYPISHGVSSIGPFPVLSGGSLDQAWLSQSGRGATLYDLLENGIVRNFWTTDDDASFSTTDLKKLETVITAHSELSDATSTDLDRFVGRGGKAIIVQGSTDMLVPPSATTDYYLRVAGRYGERTDTFLRYFLQPGYGHGVGTFTLSWDSLDALDKWVESGRFPSSPIATDASAATRGRKMPLCAYPAFPRFVAGDSRKATSFRCVVR